MTNLPRTRSCLVCGIDNPIGHRLQVETDGKRVRAGFRFRPEHTGFRGVVHGGATATVLDEMMAWAVGVGTRHFAYCAEMSVRYRRTVPASEPVVAWGEIVANRRGRVFDARAWLEDGAGNLLAEATGRYLPIAAGEHASMLEDFVEDPGKWVDVSGLGEGAVGRQGPGEAQQVFGTRDLDGPE